MPIACNAAEEFVPFLKDILRNIGGAGSIIEIPRQLHSDRPLRRENLSGRRAGHVLRM